MTRDYIYIQSVHKHYVLGTRIFYYCTLIIISALRVTSVTYQKALLTMKHVKETELCINWRKMEVLPIPSNQIPSTNYAGKYNEHLTGCSTHHFPILSFLCTTPAVIVTEFQ